MKSIIINNKQLNIDGIIFDKDGTLIEIYPMLWALAKKRLEKLVKLTSKKIIIPYLIGAGVNPITKKINPYGPLATAPKHEEVIVCAATLARCGYKYYEARQIAQTAYYEADRDMNLKEGLALIPGAKELLEKLRENKIKVFIATSDSKKRAEKMLKILNISKYITDISGSDTVKNSKPNPDAVNYIIKKYKLKPSRLAVCGDSILDIQMGIAAKVKYNIGVLTGTSSKKEMRKYTSLVLNSVKDIIV